MCVCVCVHIDSLPRLLCASLLVHVFHAGIVVQRGDEEMFSFIGRAV
jgi:hypothetical protein